MANEITGRIVRIGQTVQIPSKDGQRTFQRRELTLAEFRFDPRTGERTESENKPTLEFGGERCRELDNYAVGQAVTAAFDLQGTSYTNQQGETKWFTKANGYRIRLRPDLMAAQPQQPAPQPQSASQPQPQAPQQPQQPQGMFDNSQEQGTFDDLPWT